MLAQFRSMAVKDQWDIIFKALGLLSLVISAFVALQAYKKEISLSLSDMQKQSFAMYSSFISPAFAEDRRILGRLRSEGWAAVADQVKDVRNPAEAERQGQAILVAKIHEFVIRDQRGDVVRRIVGFFDQAAICADIKICDKASLYSLLHEEAYHTEYMLASLVAELRQTQPSFGLGLERLAAPDFLNTREK